MCEFCGKRLAKPEEAEEVIDPYLSEVFLEEVWVLACLGCYEKRHDDV